MKKVVIPFLLLFTLLLTACSSGVSQEEYDALLLENELLKQELAAYAGSYQEPINKPTINPDSIADALELEIVEYTSKYSHNYYLIVKNTSDALVEGKFSIQAYDNSDNVISVENVETYALGPGESHFLVGITEDETFAPARVQASVISAGIDSTYLGSVEHLKRKVSPSNDGIIVEVTNDGEYPIQFIEVITLFYKDGQMVDRDSEFIIDHENELKPGSTLMAELECINAFDSYRIFFSGRY